MKDKNKKVAVQEPVKSEKKIQKAENIHKALARIQKELKAPKGQFNKFGRYNYRSCGDILEAVKPLLNGLYLIIADEVVMIGDRHYIRATAKLSNGEIMIANTAFAREALNKKGMDESQITGASSSYARKYALNGLFAIDDTKDADTEKPTTAVVKKEKLLTSSDTKVISEVLQEILNAKTEEGLKLIASKCTAGKKVGNYNEKQMGIIKDAYINKFQKLSSK